MGFDLALYSKQRKSRNKEGAHDTGIKSLLSVALMPRIGIEYPHLAKLADNENGREGSFLRFPCCGARGRFTA
jgi:hypothetical protein